MSRLVTAVSSQSSASSTLARVASLSTKRAHLDIRIEAALLLLQRVGEAARVGGGIGQAQRLVGIIADADRDRIEFGFSDGGGGRSAGISEPDPRRLADQGARTRDQRRLEITPQERES